MKHILSTVLLISTIFVVLACRPTAGSAAAQFQITIPRSNAVVPGEVLTVSGVGADPAGTIEVEVLTNAWYIQDGEARVNPDGTWTFSPVHLAGKGIYNNHTIKATIIKANRRLTSVTVSGIVRRQ
ncbi:MAG: hypothetical protein LAO20_18610 [Acidobacteriia bacterium]|nr:hypothetical protein [Terriglobia bacterium]